MSLETEVKNLVTEASLLVSTFEGKSAEIDKKVNDATTAVPNAVKSQMSQTFYVDALTGDDNNAGTINAPFQSAFKVQSLVAPGTSVNILFQGGQDHIVRFSSLVCVTLKSYGSGKAKLHPYGYNEGEERNFFALHKALDVTLDNVEVYCDDFALSNQSKINGFNPGFIRLSGRQNIIIANSTIHLSNQNIYFIQQWSPIDVLDMSFDTVELIKDPSISLMRLIRQQTNSMPTYRITARELTLTNIDSFAELMAINAEKTNILTNLEI